MYSSLAKAASIAHHRLGHYPEVVAYLQGRGLTDEDILNWHIGYLDRRLDGLHMLEGRVLLPILGFSSQTVVGLSGRLLAGDGPKYWNTPFPKGRWLYGLWCAEPGKHVVLVESQMDAIALGRLGYQALATMGSSLSPWQAALVRYFTDGVIVVPHRDKPDQGPQWVSILRGQGLKAVAAWRLYPAGAPETADADWMVQEHPDRLLETLEALGATLSRQGPTVDVEWVMRQWLC